MSVGDGELPLSVYVKLGELQHLNKDAAVLTDDFLFSRPVLCALLLKGEKKGREGERKGGTGGQERKREGGKRERES